jgi:hypothetical protein
MLFCTRPDIALGEDLANFVFSIDGSSANKRIRKIDFFSPEGELVTDIPLVLPQRRRFMLGIWPWQYKTIAELEKQPASGKAFLDAMDAMVYFTEMPVKFTEHTHNIDVTLRLMVLKKTQDGPAFMGIMTNLDPTAWDGAKLAQTYLGKYPDI